MEYKQTIGGEATYTGIGLHSEKLALSSLNRQKQMKESSLSELIYPGKPKIPADIDHVVDISRSTIGITWNNSSYSNMFFLLLPE